MLGSTLPPMAPTVRHRIEKRTGVTARVLVGYEARGWLPPAELTEEDAYARSLRLVRLLRDWLTPRQVDEVFTLLGGAERREEMPKSAIPQIDQAEEGSLQAIAQIPIARSLEPGRAQVVLAFEYASERQRSENRDSPRRCCRLGRSVRGPAQRCRRVVHGRQPDFLLFHPVGIRQG